MNLASQAARATEQIATEIEAVRSVSNSVVDALTKIRSSVEAMRVHVVGAATAVEAQSAVTREASSNIQDASHAATRIASNIGAISAAVGRASQAVDTTKQLQECSLGRSGRAPVRSDRILIRMSPPSVP